MIENIEYNNNGIVKIKQNGIEYTVWTHTDIVEDHIMEYLMKRFSDKLIVHELNKIDLSVPEENLPVEIQSTIVGDLVIKYATWEQRIRSQIEQNIINYGTCWFFFDSELLRAMRSAGRKMSIDMDWFRKYINEEKLKVLTVRYDGDIEEKAYKDFDFLLDVSQTCPIASEKDDLVLNQNKMKIFANVTKGCSFTQKEINKFRNDYKRYCNTNKTDDIYRNDSFGLFLTKQNNERIKLYGYILIAIGNLSSINQILCKNKNESTSTNTKRYAGFLGIFDIEGRTQSTITRFVDRFHICKYFPGYLRNREIWDKLKGLSLNINQFENIVTGKNDVINGLDYYFNNEATNSIQNLPSLGDKDVFNHEMINATKENIKDISQETDKDKEINIKIDNKDQIININIKTKQKTIEDAWN